MSEPRHHLERMAAASQALHRLIATRHEQAERNAYEAHRVSLAPREDAEVALRVMRGNGGRDFALDPSHAARDITQILMEAIQMAREFAKAHNSVNAGLGADAPYAVAVRAELRLLLQAIEYSIGVGD